VRFLIIVVPASLGLGIDTMNVVPKYQARLNRIEAVPGNAVLELKARSCNILMSSPVAESDDRRRYIRTVLL
jgi:hypothetical protein